jgi:hypothetical protein
MHLLSFSAWGLERQQVEPGQVSKPSGNRQVKCFAREAKELASSTF